MVSNVHDGPSRSPYFDSNCRNFQVLIFNSQNRRIWVPDEIGGLIYIYFFPYTHNTQHCITMNRRAAPSARSDTSDMDAEGTGNVMLDMNNCCYSPFNLFTWVKQVQMPFSLFKQNPKLPDWGDSWGSWKEIGMCTTFKPGRRSANKSERALPLVWLFFVVVAFVGCIQFSIFNWLHIDCIMTTKAGDW